MIVVLQLLILNLSLNPECSSNFWPNKSLQNLSLLREQTQCNHSQITVKGKWRKAKKKRWQSQISVFCKSRFSSPSIIHREIKNPILWATLLVQELPFPPIYMVFSLFFSSLFLLVRYEILWCMGFGLGRLAFFFSFHQDRVPFVQHLHRTTSGAPGNSAALCMTLKWNYFFMHFRRVSRASLWPNRAFCSPPASVSH